MTRTLLNRKCQTLITDDWQHSLLHLGLVSSNSIAWKASHDCPYQSIVCPRLIGGNGRHSNNTVAFNEPGRSLFIIFIYYLDDLSNFIHIFNYLNKLFADYLHPSVHNIHCIATHIIKGIQFSTRFSVFKFFRSEMALVSSLFFSWPFF